MFLFFIKLLAVMTVMPIQPNKHITFEKIKTLLILYVNSSLLFINYKLNTSYQLLRATVFLFLLSERSVVSFNLIIITIETV